MRKVKYRCDDSGYECGSMLALRTHVEFFNSKNHRHDYHGDYVHRFILKAGKWECDDNFLAQINVVHGKLILRRIKVHSIPGIGIPSNAKP